MKIGLAQIQPIKGDITKNIVLHRQVIELAIANQVDALFFPELSLTAYEPELADRLKVKITDTRFDRFQELSTSGGLTIGVGVPIAQPRGVEIGMLLFQPNQARQKYAKQLLHEDELPYFIAGKEQVLIAQKEMIIAPAICYESLQTRHFYHAIDKGATIYVASVAKAQKGIDKTYPYFSTLAKTHSIPILMVNNIGYCDSFRSAGQSAIWDKQGDLIGHLSDSETGLLIYDSILEKSQSLSLNKLSI